MFNQKQWMKAGMLFMCILLMMSVFAQENAKPLLGKKICLDPGHGGSDTGAVGLNGLTENKINLLLCNKLRAKLEKAGATVVMTRYHEETAVSLRDRSDMNRNEQSDLFVSIHHNANSQADRNVNRSEIFYHFKDRHGPSEDAARYLCRELQAAYKLPDTKTYMCWAYGVLRNNRFPAILGEASYISNKEEAERLLTPEHQNKQINAYYKAIMAFFKGGRPQMQWVENSDCSNKCLCAKASIDKGDELLDPQSVQIYIDEDLMTDYKFNPITNTIVAYIPKKYHDSQHIVSITMQNLEGHHAHAIRKEFDGSTLINGIKLESENNYLFDGILKDKRFVLDAQGGGDDPYMIGENGLRASDANMQSVLYLADYLRCAGANVTLTRDCDESMDNVARIRSSMVVNPDFFISIGHRHAEPGMKEKAGQDVSRIAYRWGDSKELAEATIPFMREMMGTGSKIGNVRAVKPLPTELHGWSSWEIMHGAQNFSSIYYSPLMFDSPGVPERLENTACMRKEALSVFYGLVKLYGKERVSETGSIQGIIRDSKTKKGLKNCLVWLDDKLVNQTESDGVYTFKLVRPGKHNVKILHHKKGMLLKSVTVHKNKPVQLDINL